MTGYAKNLSQESNSSGSAKRRRTFRTICLVGVISLQIPCVVEAATSDSPRTVERYGNSSWSQIVQTMEVGRTAEQYGHRPKFTIQNIEFFVDYAADSEYQRFHTAWNNGNHVRARRIFRDYVNAWAP